MSPNVARRDPRVARSETATTGDLGHERWPTGRLHGGTSGHPLVAERWLTWLDGHCTSWGSLPEKVLPDGNPAGPAPLAWTAALVVLTENELATQRSGVGGESVPGVG